MAGRILVLDDEENYAEMLQDLLRENNYLVDMATRPERAIAQLEEIPYDLVISDYKMPVMDGSDFLKKSRELYPNLPFILVSGLMNTPELVKVANMSVTLVMEKPLDTEAFLRHVARFSEPMSEEEKAEYVLQGPAESSEVVSLSYPEEPRFFSASNFLTIRFLQSVWAAANEGSEIFLLESSGGDAELVLKDLSHWRNNGDMPVDVVDMAATIDEAVGQIRPILSDFEKSRVIGVRIASVGDIGSARKLTESVKREVEGSESALLSYILVDDGASAAAFEDAAGKEGAVVPTMSLRPSDTAAYARRFARIAAERLGRTKCAEFTPEAAYAILAYGWPGNYKQIQEVIQKAVNESEDTPLTLDVFNSALGESITPIAPENRIAALMKGEQRRFLKEQMNHLGITAAELAKKLELDSGVQTEGDLNTMPLLRAELGSF
jgi:CheY-like chemotaxis protein